MREIRKHAFFGDSVIIVTNVMELLININKFAPQIKYCFEGRMP